MRWMAMVAGGTFVMGLTLGIVGTHVLSAQPQEPFKRTLLLKTEPEGLEGQEAHVMIVDVAPGARSGRHYHPGPVFAYTLSGSGAWEADGMPPKALEPGAALYVPPKHVHEDVGGPAGEKLLVVYIIPKGQPLAVPVP